MRIPFLLSLALVTAGALIVVAPGRAEVTPPGRPPATEPAMLRPQDGAARLVVILADNAGTETTDLLVPHGILSTSGAVEVLIVATNDGPVELMPALTILPDMSVAAFDAAHPRGADVVVVPAFHSRGTAETTAFLRRQAALGAMILAICEGSEPVARAGLLAQRSATTHWHAQRRMARRYPATRWLRDARYVIDGPVMSSSGVSASVPVTLALLDLLAGREVAGQTARTLGIPDWGPGHDSARFSLEPGTIWRASRNFLSFWRHETLQVPVEEGFDGTALALQADAWSRTYRSRLFARNAAGTVTSAQGVTFLTDPVNPADPLLPLLTDAPLTVLDLSLAAIAARHDPATADFVALQLEYPWRSDPAAR